MIGLADTHSGEIPHSSHLYRLDVLLIFLSLLKRIMCVDFGIIKYLILLFLDSNLDRWSEAMNYLKKKNKKQKRKWTFHLRTSLIPPWKNYLSWYSTTNPCMHIFFLNVSFNLIVLFWFYGISFQFPLNRFVTTSKVSVMICENFGGRLTFNTFR